MKTKLYTPFIFKVFKLDSSSSGLNCTSDRIVNIALPYKLKPVLPISKSFQYSERPAIEGKVNNQGIPPENLLSEVRNQKN